MNRKIPRRKPASKKFREGFQGFPAATIAYYGPDNARASKVVVGIFSKGEEEAVVLERMFSNEMDARHDSEIQQKILDLIKDHKVRSVAVTDGIIGCPHEAGIDYPEGKSCPQCPYWAGRDLFTQERIN